MTTPQRRSSYRVLYPPGEGPILKISRGVFPVLNLSEGGLSFAADLGQFLTGERFSVKLQFKDGETFQGEGEVVRLSLKSVSLRLTNNFPYKKLIEEQIRLRSIYASG